MDATTPFTTVTQTIEAPLREAARIALGLDQETLTSLNVVPTANPEFGDYQCSDAMTLARRMKRNPREIAQAIVSALQPHPVIASVELAGPGFINIRINPAWLAEHVVGLSHHCRLGVPDEGAGRTIVLDYSSPNVAKPMHIGHIRSTIIGNAIDRLYRYLGFRVVADNHIGDWGTQFGIIIMGYRHLLNHDALRDNPVEELERLYVASYARAKEDEAWMDQCRQELVKLQRGDPENLSLWREFVALSLKEFERIYGRLDVRFDWVRGESYYNDRLPGVLARLEAAGLTEISEGATVVKLDEDKLPLCIVRKRDGAFNYATTDLATVISRVEEFDPDRIVYVTDERQQLHFKQFFTICRKLGYTNRLEHVWFGLMRLPHATFSTREGNVIKLEKLLDEAESRALELVRQSSPDMSADRQREVARAVGIGAVKYADLSQNPQTTVTFTWEKAMALDGNSAPYLQYACARMSSVLDKYHERFPDGDIATCPLRLEEPIERVLALSVARFPETVARAATGYRPSILADYLYALAQTYSTFYQNVPFLKAPEGVRESRVRLCGIVARILRQGLALLGIEAPERI